MSRAVLAGALIALTALSPAAAQSWGVGVGVGYGGPAYYGPPPVYLYEEPPIVYEQPPVLYAPAPVVRSAVSPDAVFDALERAGYREFSPMAFRDGVYKLNAVNHRGDLVALEVSALSGAIEREYLLAARRPIARVAPPVLAPIAPSSTPRVPRARGEDPLVVY